ncbi:hypothetical protein [Streptomyces sp. H39-C1]|uniref:hypothetical protein n=1 Tax=Streptomyces sp. H39-C1 TaxID=3004355 RepID=UPI0022AEE7DE|nr:hypothetical protein [Streptomyces sp. H39-C1]MCZ4098034.1 hypothetical protein [Streptomyces sp. H39-C1]
MSAAERAGDDWIRGITIRQPWAACVLAGKTVENRSRPWSWRGWILIHAGKAKPVRTVLRDPLVARTIRGCELHLGAVIGVARLTSCHQDDGPDLCSLWAQAGAHHLVLGEIQELALPVPFDGTLGPWKPTPDLVDQVLLQLPHLRPETTL